jgi:hypothetical protein
MKKNLTAVVLLTALGLLTACGGAAPATTAAPAETTAAPAAETTAAETTAEETKAEELLDALDLTSVELPKDRRDELAEYTFERSVDEVDDEEIKRAGYIYTVRTKICWGSRRLSDEERPKLEVLTFWRKKQ